MAFALTSPAKVEAGKQYAIVFSDPDEDFLGGVWVAWALDYGPDIVDRDGVHCAAGAYAGGRAWTFGTPEVGPEADFFFQTYVVPARHVTVRKTGAGTGAVSESTGAIDCGTICSADFLQGQTVTLNATPAVGSAFAGWQGGCSGSSATCSLTVTDDTTVTAIFVKKRYSLTIRKIGSGSVASHPAGILCGRRCRALLVAGPVTLTAKPAPGFVFSRWLGACHGTRPVCHVALSGAASATAIFTKKR